MDIKHRASLGGSWKRPAACLVALTLQYSSAAPALAQVSPAAASRPPGMMDREQEIALALSACPPALAEKAAVYFLQDPRVEKALHAVASCRRDESLVFIEPQRRGGDA